MLLALSVTTAGRAQAQDRAGASASERDAAVFDGARSDSSGKVLDRKFWAVAVALNVAMTVDTKSTFDVVRACRTCSEMNPLVAPFIRRGPAVTFTAGEVFDAGVMTMAARMKASDRTWVRRTWWVAPAALIVGHSIAQRHNYNLLK